MNRHKGFEWAKVLAKPETNTEKPWALNEMERTSGTHFADVLNRIGFS